MEQQKSTRAPNQTTGVQPAPFRQPVDTPLRGPSESEQLPQHSFAGQVNVQVPAFLADLDLNVLASLPLTVRREVELQYEREFGVRRPLDLVSRLRTPAAESGRVQTPAHALPLATIHASDVKWDELGEGTTIEDHVDAETARLRAFVDQAVERRNLEAVCSLLRGCVRRVNQARFLTSALWRAWHDALSQLVQHTNEMVLSRYDFPLGLDPPLT
jgi:hypothetical protein